MTDQEWDAIALLLEKGFAHRDPFDNDAQDVYKILLDGYDAAEISRAIQVVIRQGEQWLPPVAVIVAAIHADPELPTFAQMLEEVFGPEGVLRTRTTVRKGFWEIGERDRADEIAQVEHALHLHRLIQSFIARVGWRWLKQQDDLDGEFGYARRRELREAWDEHLSDDERRDALTLAPPRARNQQLGRVNLKAIEGSRDGGS